MTDDFLDCESPEEVVILKKSLKALGYHFSIEFDTYAQKVYHREFKGIEITFPHAHSGSINQDKMMAIAIHTAFVSAVYSIVYTGSDVIQGQFYILDEVLHAIQKELETRG